LESLKTSGHSRYVPWVWGINGVFSVLAPVSSIALSVTSGISVLLLSAIPIYLVAGFALSTVENLSPAAPDPAADSDRLP
jgi:hypothetical protein